MVIKLYRIKYGKHETLMQDREFTLDKDNEYPVGTIAEYYEMFPKENFEIIDPISGHTFVTSHEAFVYTKGGEGNEDLL